jgi:chromosome segregation ATPase
VEEENDNITDEKLKSLSNAHQDLADKVRDLSTMVDRVARKIAGYELDGILSSKIAEKIRELEMNKSNIDSLKNEVDTININLEVAEKNIGNFSGFVLSSERLFDHLQQEIKALHSQLTGMTSSSTKFNHLEAEVNRLVTTTNTIQREMKRRPTEEIHTIAFKDGTEKKYRVYKGKAGLVKPHRVTIDPISGNKYVDLTERLN